MNQGIYNEFSSSDNVIVIKVRRLEWLGRTVGINGTRTVKTLLEGKPGGGIKKEDLE
jgi:hypothetical protein